MAYPFWHYSLVAGMCKCNVSAIANVVLRELGFCWRLTEVKVRGLAEIVKVGLNRGRRSCPLAAVRSAAGH